MAQRVVDGDIGELGQRPAPEGAARGGEDERLDGARVLVAHQLVQRRVLGVDGDQQGAAALGGIAHERATGDEALLVRERDIDPGLERGERRAQAGDPDAGVQHEVGRDLECQRGDALRALEHASREPVAGPRRGGWIGEGEGRDAVLARERDQRSVVATGSQRDDLDIGEGRDDIEGLAADRPRRTQQGDALHCLPG